MVTTIGPRSVLDQTMADIGYQAAQPLLEDAEQQRQDIITPQPVQPSYVSQVPSYESLAGVGMGSVAPTGVAPIPSAEPSGGSFSSMMAGITPESLMAGRGLTPQPQQPAQSPLGMQSGFTPPVQGVMGTPTAMPTGAVEGDLQTKARAYAQKYNLDPERFVRQIQTESQFNPGAVNPNSGAAGLGQFMPATAQGLGIDPMDPDQALEGAARYMRQNLDANGGDYRKALAAYNWGPGNVASWDGSDESLPAETRGYIQSILGSGQPSRTPVQAEQTPAAQAQAPTSVGRPTQFAEGLSYDEQIAACGLAGIAWFISKTGHPPQTVADVRDAAAATKAWDPGSGMHGAQATAGMLRQVGIATHVEDGVDWAKIRRDVQTGNPVMFDTDAGSNGHYYTVAGARQRSDGQWEYDLSTSATDLRASGGRQWFTADEIPSLGFGTPSRTIYTDNPQTPAPSPAAGRAPNAPIVAATAGAGQSPPSPGTSAGSLPLPADASQLDAARAGTDGFQASALSMKGMPEDQPLDGASSDEAAIESAQTPPTLGNPQRSDLTWQGNAPYYPGVEAQRMGEADSGYVDESGPREATPGSVGAQPIATSGSGSSPSTESQNQEPYGPPESEAGPPMAPESPFKPLYDAAGAIVGYVQGAADQIGANMAQNRQNVEEANQATGAPDANPITSAMGVATAPAARVYGEAIGAANTEQDDLEAAMNDRMSEFARTARVPLDVVHRAFAVANAALLATPQAGADTIDAALSAAGFGRDTLGIDLPIVGRVGIADIVDLGPASNIGVGHAGNVATSRVGQAIASRIPNAAEPIERGAAAVGRGIATGARAVGEAAQGAGRRIGEGLAANAERTAQADARMAAEGSTVAPAAMGVVPEGGPKARPIKPIAELGMDGPTVQRVTTEQSAAHAENGGSTFHPTQGNMAGKPLYSVSLYPEASEILDAAPTPAQIEAYVRKYRRLLADDRLSVGTWFNTEDGKHYLDVVATLPDRAQSEQLGRAYNQYAIYGLEPGVGEISTGGNGTVPRVMPPAQTRLPLRDQADEAMRGRLGEQARTAATGQPLDWWEREFGSDPLVGGDPKAMGEAAATAQPLEQALRQSAAQSPDGLAHLSGPELAPFMPFRSPSLRVLGSGIGKPMGTDDTRRLAQYGLEQGWGDWYRIYGQHIANLAPGISREEGTALFAHYSSQLSPEQALNASMATAMAARDTKSFAGMTPEQAHAAVYAMMDTVGITKPSISASDVNGARKLYDQGFKVQSDDSWKTATFQSALTQGQDPTRLDVGYTGDVQAQRVHGYQAFHAPAADVKAAKAAGQTAPIDWQNRTMSDEGAWQYMGTIGRWLGHELGVPPSDAQAALWVVGQRGVVPLNSTTLKGFRDLNPSSPVFTDPAKLAVWKRAAEDLKAGTRTNGEVFDELRTLGVFDLKDPAALEQIQRTKSYVNAQQAWRAGGYDQMAYPGASPMSEGLRYESHPTRPWMRAGPEQGPLSPLHARALEEAPTIATPGGRIPQDEGRRVPDLKMPHVVVDVGDTPGGAIALPSINPRIASGVAQNIADRGEPVVLRRAVAPGEMGNSVQITIDSVAAPGLGNASQQIRDTAAALGAEVHWDGRQVRIFLDDLSPEDAESRVISLYDAVQSHGINADAIKVGASYVERFEPGGAGSQGAQAATTGRSIAQNPRDAQLADRIYGALRPDEAGAAVGRGGPNDLQPGRPIGENGTGRPQASSSSVSPESTTAYGAFGVGPPERWRKPSEQELRSAVGQKYPDIRGPINDGTAAQIGEPSAEMLRDSRMPRDAVHPDLRAAGIGPEITPQVDMSGRANAGAGTVQVSVPRDRLAAVNNILSQGVASTFSGGVSAAAADQLGDPNDPNRQAKAFVAGALAPPLLARGGRAAARRFGRGAEELQGGARIGLGDVPPSKVNQQGLPGIEHPPYTKPQIPDVSEERNVGSRPSMNPGGRTDMLPGMDRIDPLTDPARFVPPNERSLLPSSTHTTTPAIVENVIRQEQAQARRLARQAATNPEAVQPGQVGLPTVDNSPPLVQRIRDATEPWSRRLNITRYAGMLSDSATQVFNLTSNAVMQGVDVGATPIAAAIDAGRSAITGNPRQVFFSEAPARIAGMRGGLKVGLQNAAEILRTGLTPVDAAKQLEGGASGMATGNAVADFAFEAPLRALAASDAVFRTSAQGGHLAAEGMAAAMRANPGVKITPDMLSEAMKDPAVLEKAQKLAARSVLQEDRTVTVAYQKFLQALGPEGRALVSTELPFVKTPYNVIAQGVGLTPAGLLGVVQDMAEHKPARDIEYRVARVALGTAVMGVAAADYASGNLTGPRPTDPKELSTLPPGWQPWSQKIPLPGGGTGYLPLVGLGPLALPAVAAILMGEAAKKGGDMSARAGRVALGVGQYASQNTFFQSLSNIGGLLDQRDAEHNIQRNVQQVVSQFSPHIVGGGALGREIQRVMGMPMRDPQGALEALLATHPLTANRVEPRQDVLGRPSVPYASGPIAAVARIGKENDAGVIRAFRTAREGLPLAAPKEIRDPSTDQAHTLTPQQQHRWRRVFGSALQENWTGYGNPRDADTLRKVESDARTTANQTILGQR